MELRQSVVIITGATSGIGRCTALEFARSGARVVLAARDSKALDKAAAECERSGAEALAVECDVADEDQVQTLAREAVDRFGRIDVWVNNAGVGLYGRFEDCPSASFRQVIETNLCGVVHGTRAALRYFRRQHGGVLINVSSQVATGGIPYSSAYAATKFAVRMLDDCLRQELLDTPDIQVCTVLPASIDTPFFEHAANYSGYEVKPLGSVHDPLEVARAIVKLAEKPEREVFIGKHGYVMGAAHAMAPDLYNKAVRQKADRDHFTGERTADSDGNLFSPQSPTQIYGGWHRRGRGGSVAAVAALGAAAFGLWVATRRGRGGPHIQQAA